MTKNELRSIWWCAVVEGVVHAGNWVGGGVSVLTEDYEGEETCQYNVAIPVAELQPWRERKHLGTPCTHCEQAVDEDLMLMEEALEHGFGS